MTFPEMPPPTHCECFSDALLPPCGEKFALIEAKPLTQMQQLQHKKLFASGVVLKQQVFAAMQHLEGWCSREKASLLIDIILATRPQVVVEIGVFGGKSLMPMAFALKHVATGKVYGIDPWEAEMSIEGMEAEHLDWWATLDHDKILASLLQEIDVHALKSQIELIRQTSEKCPPIFAIDLLHIDGNHSEKTSLGDVTKWVPLVREGGLIIFDDINWPSTLAAKKWLDTTCTKLAEYSEENVWGIWIK